MRPPISDARLERHGDRLVLSLKTRWNDGTTHLRFEPTELLERLAALVPRPQKNLLLYHGVFAANAKLRRQVVAYGRPKDLPRDPPRHRPRTSAARNATWAELMRRGLDVDALECPECQARMRFVASILRPAVVRRILDSLGLPSAPVAPAPARAPPSSDPSFDLDLDVA